RYVLATVLCVLAELGSGHSWIAPGFQVYCTGELLKQVQMAKLFTDDKYFVDMKLCVSPEEVVSAFQNWTRLVPDAALSYNQLQEFVNLYFDAPGQEFEPWMPDDWQAEPPFLKKIVDPAFRLWASELHALWKSLGRKVRLDVKMHPELYSQIYTPHPLIVPGGRFRELYYWDSYWIIKGLLLSGMQKTTMGMIENFLYLVERYGFVPNGGRVYYERRTQPPFLTLMVDSYYQATLDIDFLRKALPVLEKEYTFWMTNRSVEVMDTTGTSHALNHYKVEAGGPRPESYSDDMELAMGMQEGAQQILWAELKSGAESGWDFSSRWFIDSAGHNFPKGTLKDTKTSFVVPVDLNALLCRCERTLATFNEILSKRSALVSLQRRMQAVEAIFWDGSQGSWFDFNQQSMTTNKAFYPSNLAPLWAKCYSKASFEEQALRYLQVILKYGNGVPTSMVQTGQQWDFPNAWPPLQQMLIEGGYVPAIAGFLFCQQIAGELAQKWVKANWMAYKEYKAMFEKYDMTGNGKPGGGGEYEVQLGFGWTNGVALQLLEQFGDRLVSAASPMATCVGAWLILFVLLSVF
uniref:Trehalase n=1 Tax=Erpetoichthys calabaricus TaxID=27687 RepID=A0A8C4SLI7_ERPCA